MINLWYLDYHKLDMGVTGNKGHPRLPYTPRQLKHRMRGMVPSWDHRRKNIYYYLIAGNKDRNKVKPNLPVSYKAGQCGTPPHWGVGGCGTPWSAPSSLLQSGAYAIRVSSSQRLLWCNCTSLRLPPECNCHSQQILRGSRDSYCHPYLSLLSVPNVASCSYWVEAFES